MNERQKEVVTYQLKSERDVLKELERQYDESLKGIDQQILEFQQMHDSPSKVYRIEYQRRMKQQVEAQLELLHSNNYQTIDQYLRDVYTNGYVGTMYDLHGQNIPVIAPIDPKSVIRAVTLDSQLKEPLYESLGVDVKHLKKTISSEISRGISSGLLFEDIARNVHAKTKAPLSRAKTIVRTEGHRIQEASAEDARQVAKSKGADVVKQWDATLDGQTRENHRLLDGQIRETDEPFEIAGKKAMYPGDFGYAEEDCNCRCLALTRARKALDADELKTMQERARFFGLLADDSKDFGHQKEKTTFAGFKKKYLKAAETVENSGKSGIINAGGALDSFNRKLHYTDSTDDLVNTNPNYGKSVGYRVNCQRCVPAYELRRRGYDVHAKPALVTARGGISSKDPICQNSKWYKGIFSGIQWEMCPSGSGVDTIKQTMAKWGDGARAEVYVLWKNGGAHVFVAEQVNGKTVFFDPQGGSPDYEKAFGTVKNGFTMFARIDNLPVTDAIKDCVENTR